MISEEIQVEMGGGIENEVLIPRGVLEIQDLDETVVNQLLVDMGCWYGLSDLYYKVAMGMDLAKSENKLNRLGVPVRCLPRLRLKEKMHGVARDVAVLLAKYKANTMWSRRCVQKMIDF